MTENLIVKDVAEDEDSYTVVSECGTGFGLSKKYNVAPKEGDVIALHVVNGSTIRGCELNGVQVFYKTDEDLDREHKEFCAKMKSEREEEFKRSKDSLDAKYNALPQVFKESIDKFRKNNPNFRVEYESYEMFCCEQAIEIANALKTKEVIQEFHHLPWEEQVEKVPNLSLEHSGNTFEASCKLAYWYLENPENVTKLHGSLSPLVGSEEYGDVPKDSNEK